MMGAPPRDAAPSADEILDVAADLIDQRGLAVGRYAGPGDCLCAMGAIQAAFYQLGGRYSLHGIAAELAAEARLREFTEGEPVTRWSDHTPERQVVRALRRAATAEREHRASIEKRATGRRRSYEW